MSIKREKLTPEWVAEVTAEMQKYGGFEPLSEAQREASLQAVLKKAPPGDVWVFGYGSLIWNPQLHYLESAASLLYGYHRRFCFWTQTGRGTPEKPGLMLALEKGGACWGVMFRLAGSTLKTELELLWRREMLSGVYTPRWVAVKHNGQMMRALSFVINPEHSQYAGRLSLEETAYHVAHAKGWLGASRDYLEQTVAHLAELGLRDRYLTNLAHRVKSATPP